MPVEGRTAVRVRYCETDRMNVVHHTHYLVPENKRGFFQSKVSLSNVYICPAYPANEYFQANFIIGCVWLGNVLQYQRPFFYPSLFFE